MHGFFRNVSVVLAALACGVAWSLAGADEARNLFESLHGQKYRDVLATRDKTDDVALAGEFVAAAGASRKQPQLSALLCERAYLLASKAPEGRETAIAAMSFLAETQPSTAKQCREKILAIHQGQYNVSRGPARQTAREAMVGFLLAAADEEAAGGDYVAATGYLRRASYLAGGTRDFKAVVAARLKRVGELQRNARDIDAARKRLEADPADVAVREKLIWLYLLGQDDPAGAARYVNADCSEVIRTYVSLAARPPDSLAETVLLEVAAWYRSLSAKASPGAKAAMFRRAKVCYETFLTKHLAGDASRALASKGLDEVGAELAKLGPAESGAARPKTYSPTPVGPRPAGGPGPMALVSSPAKLAGLLQWTIETRPPRHQLTEAAFSTDGRRVAIAGRCGTIRILDAATGDLVRALVGHEARVDDLAFSPDGKTLASLSWGNTIRLWDFEAGGLVRVLQAERCGGTMAFSPDGRFLAVGADGHDVALWSVQTGKRAGLLQGDRVVQRMAWSSDGRRLAVGRGYHEADVMIWDPKSGRPLRVISGLVSAIGGMAWSRDGKTLAIGEGQDPGGIHLWDVTAKKVVRKLAGQAFRAGPLAWSPDGKKLACGVKSHVEVWEADTGKLSAALPAEHWALNDLAWSPDGKALV